VFIISSLAKRKNAKGKAHARSNFTKQHIKRYSHFPFNSEEYLGMNIKESQIQQN